MEQHRAAYDLKLHATNMKFNDDQHQFNALNGDPSNSQPKLEDLIRFVIAETGDPVRVLEFYYWSQLAGLTDAMRTLSALPPHKRAMIQTFLAMTESADSIQVTLGQSGELTLYSAEVAANLKAFRQATS